MLLWFLMVETITSEDMIVAFKEMPESTNITLCRFLCAVFLHITLVPELLQGLNMMKFANNHWWMFRSWRRAYCIGMMQMGIVFTVETVNLVVLVTNNTIMDIIMNFLALVIISEFDDYFINTVSDKVMSLFLESGEMEIADGKTASLDKVVKIRVTTSEYARFDVPGNKYRKDELDIDNLVDEMPDMLAND